jgi:hypothetical protein
VLVTLYWLFPDRGSRRENARDDALLWDGYRELAGQLGFGIQVVSPELIDISCDDAGRQEIYVEGRLVTPHDAVFITEFQTFPSMIGDIWNFQAIAESLRLAGFYLPVPPGWSIIGNDKLLTVAALGAHLKHGSVLPSVRLTLGRDLDERDWSRLLSDIPFPVVVKPANWSGQQGIVVVEQLAALEKVLQLASAADLTVIIQRCLDPGALTCYRLYCLGGEVLATRLYRPAPGQIFIGHSGGGESEWVTCPDPIAEDARAICARVPASFVCLDFLAEGDRYYLSEIELDASFNVRLLRSPEAHSVLRRRFTDYLARHQAWLDGRPDGAAR